MAQRKGKSQAGPLDVASAIPAVFYRPNQAASEDWIVAQGGQRGSRSHGDRAWFESDAQLRIAIGGNRAGKTTKLVLEAGAMAIGCRPWYAQSSPWYTRGLWSPGAHRAGYHRARYVVPSFRVHLPEVITQFEHWWPTSWWTPVVRQGQVTEIRFYNHSVILFMSHHMDFEDFEGIEADANHYDEPPPKKAFTALERGVVSTGGRSQVGATLLDSSGWFWDEIIGPAEGGQLGEDVYVSWHSIWDNTAENGGCATQKARNVSVWLRKVTDPDERMAREHGYPMHIGGLVLSKLQDIHIVTPFPIPPRAIIVGAIDPAGARPFAGLHVAYWMDVDEAYIKGGKWIGAVFDETFLSQSRNDIRGFAESWNEREEGKREPIHPTHSTMVIIDPISEEVQKADRLGRTLRQILFEDYGISTVTANRQNKRARLMDLNASIGSGHYVFFSDLARFHAERRRWSWDQGSPKLTKGQDDVCDCLSYIHSSNPMASFQQWEGEEDGVWVPPEYRDREQRKEMFAERWREKRSKMIRDGTLPKRRERY